jgi:hypothetical protein
VYVMGCRNDNLVMTDRYTLNFLNPVIIIKLCLKYVHNLTLDKSIYKCSDDIHTIRSHSGYNLTSFEFGI